MRHSMLARDCLRSGLSGALAAGVFGTAMAGALLATGPQAVPATTAGKVVPATSHSRAVPHTLRAGTGRVEVLGRYRCGAGACTAEVALPSAVPEH